MRITHGRRLRVAAGMAIGLLLLPTPRLTAQTLQIGVIDFYGLSRLAASDLRPALLFHEGDALEMSDSGRPASLTESEQRLSRLPGVSSARINAVCCDQGRVIVYVGIEEVGRTARPFRSAPHGSQRLPADVIDSYRKLGDAVMAAVARGDASEDDSQGHAFFHDSAARAVQEQFLVYASRDLELLRRVLRESDDAVHRAVAAEVIGYVADKQAVVNDLVYAMSDPAPDVRNNAMRTLGVFAKAVPTATRLTPVVPVEPFLALLNSPIWTDRNKASFALAELTANRDPARLTRIRQSALAALTEMARWKSPGHALPAFVILGRIAGVPDDEIVAAFSQGKREELLRRLAQTK
jgi:hypothetical protein